MSRLIPNTAGFTLIELLLATVIFAMIVGVVFGSFAAVTSGVDKGRQSMDLYRTGRTALQRIAQEVSAAMWFEGDASTALLGEDGTGDDQSRDRITVATIPYRRFAEQAPGNDLCDVSYYIEENAQGQAALFREEDCTRDDERQGDGLKIEFTDLAVGLEITYFDAEDSHDAWPPRGGDAASSPLPCRIRLALTLRDDQQQERAFITTVAPPMRGNCTDENAPRPN